MLGLSLEETRVYREAKAEGEQIGEQRGRRKNKLETVPRLPAKGLSVDEVAEVLELSIEEVRQAADQARTS